MHGRYGMRVSRPAANQAINLFIAEIAAESTDCSGFWVFWGDLSDQHYIFGFEGECTLI